MRTILVFLFISMAGVSFAQRKKKKSNEETVTQPTSVDPSLPTKELAPKKSKSRKVSNQGPTFDAERDYYDRMAALEKAKTKNERMSEKPQYSNPMYFGHKHPPKKRPPNKMKFCKVCGIRH